MFRSALVRLSSVARKAVATGTAAGASNVSQIEYVLKNQLNRAAYSGFAHQTLFLQKEVSTATGFFDFPFSIYWVFPESMSLKFSLSIQILHWLKNTSMQLV